MYLFMGDSVIRIDLTPTEKFLTDEGQRMITQKCFGRKTTMMKIIINQKGKSENHLYINMFM